MPVPPRIPVILGPTASGKTEIGIALAHHLNGEIISIDSRQVYKGLKIGTATPEGVWKEGVYLVDGVPHHLMNFLAPDQPYNAGDFSKDAERLIREIQSRGRTPLLVGGTGFYFKSLHVGLPRLPKGDAAVRKQLEERIEREGLESLYNELKNVDPEAARRISQKDRHKIMRALEIHRLTGRPFSASKNMPRPPSRNQFVVMALHVPKDKLEKRIEERSKKMVEQGMIEETRRMLDQGYSKNCPALAGFGYKEAVQVLEGVLPESEFLARLIGGTKAYAKRQRTWFRTQVHPVWFDGFGASPKEISLKMKGFIQGYHN